MRQVGVLREAGQPSFVRASADEIFITAVTRQVLDVAANMSGGNRLYVEYISQYGHQAFNISQKFFYQLGLIVACGATASNVVSFDLVYSMHWFMISAAMIAVPNAGRLMYQRADAAIYLAQAAVGAVSAGAGAPQGEVPVRRAVVDMQGEVASLAQAIDQRVRHGEGERGQWNVRMLNLSSHTGAILKIAACVGSTIAVVALTSTGFIPATLGIMLSIAAGVLTIVAACNSGVGVVGTQSLDRFVTQACDSVQTLGRGLEQVAEVDAAELVEAAQTDHLGISTVSFAMFGLRSFIVYGVARNSLVAQAGGNFSILQPAFAFAVFSLLALLISNNVARSWSSSPPELRSLLDSAARETYRQVRHPSQGLRALLEPGRDVQNVVSGGCQRLRTLSAALIVEPGVGLNWNDEH